MTGDLAIITQGQLYGQRWGIMMAVSIVLHLFLFSAVIIMPGLIPSTDADNIVYEVDLVDTPSNIQAEAPLASKAEETAAKTDSSAKRITAREEKKTQIEVDKIPINKKKTAVKKEEKNTKAEEADHLKNAISDLKKKTRSEENRQTHLDQAISQLQNKVGVTIAKSGASGTGTSGSLSMRIYQENVKSYVQNNWSYPAAIQNLKDLEVTVLLKVKEDGTILESKFIKKSGDSIFDKSVSKAIERSNPIPPFPEGYNKNYEEFEIRFTLKELMES
jgi:colicin import membrane protein